MRPGLFKFFRISVCWPSIVADFRHFLLCSAVRPRYLWISPTGGRYSLVTGATARFRVGRREKVVIAGLHSQSVAFVQAGCPSGHRPVPERHQWHSPRAGPSFSFFRDVQSRGSHLAINVASRGRSRVALSRASAVVEPQRRERWKKK